MNDGPSNEDINHLWDALIAGLGVALVYASGAWAYAHTSLSKIWRKFEVIDRDDEEDKILIERRFAKLASLEMSKIFDDRFDRIDEHNRAADDRERAIIQRLDRIDDKISDAPRKDR
jgi:hypothetical protein